MFGLPRMPYRTIGRVIAALALIWLLSPWVCLSAVAALVHLGWRTARAALSLRFVFASTLRCPAGHASELKGVFECRTCGSLFAGWAFQPCPVCRESCGYVPCEHCGLAVRNPFLQG